MGRLRRFEHHRFVGTRDTMTVYDCDAPEQFAELEERVQAGDLFDRALLQTFAPDDLAEAASRGFKGL